ncbi:hypothetical protein T07_6816 [Trichinella nelsoni]|uniref:Uncharacterized protein n=1 Tax=Trichinella nelsoni TaxID=6336 RepID=A0A0V0RQG6_9BILA|nr:hypothetical protein T07_6816 [Trichinella nelsoni]
MSFCSRLYIRSLRGSIRASKAVFKMTVRCMRKTLVENNFAYQFFQIFRVAQDEQSSERFYHEPTTKTSATSGKLRKSFCRLVRPLPLPPFVIQFNFCSSDHSFNSVHTPKRTIQSSKDCYPSKVSNAIDSRLAGVAAVLPLLDANFNTVNLICCTNLSRSAIVAIKVNNM